MTAREIREGKLLCPCHTVVRVQLRSLSSRLVPTYTVVRVTFFFI